MDRETLIRAILECNFAGYDSDIIDIAVKRIMENTGDVIVHSKDAEPVKQERCEFCKDGKTFWGAELILDNEGNWHNIRYCPICGAKMDEIEEEKTPKLIDATEILKSEHQHYAPMADEYYVLVRDIENAPTVGAVPVVKCKDCKYWEYDVIFSDGWCRGKHQGNPNWFCADGERREDAKTN